MRTDFDAGWDKLAEEVLSGIMVAEVCRFLRSYQTGAYHQP